MLKFPVGYSLRIATLRDVNKIAPIQEKLHKDLELPEKFCYKLAKINIKNLINNGLVILLVWRGEVVGTLGFIINNTMYSEIKSAVEVGFYILEKHRVGAGYGMFKYARELLRDQGINYMFGAAPRKYPEVEYIYKRLGMEFSEKMFRGRI